MIRFLKAFFKPYKSESFDLELEQPDYRHDGSPFYGRLACPEDILASSQKPKEPKPRESGAEWARERWELDQHVIALGQQGRRIVSVVADCDGQGYHVIWQDWG